MTQNELRQDTDSYNYELSGGLGHYRLSWPNQLIDIVVERIKPTGPNEVYAELTAWSKRPASAGHLGYGRVGLTSPASRKAMAKTLSEEEPEVRWERILQQLAVTIIKEHRQGIPEVAINGVVQPESLRWFIHPLVEHNQPTLIYGDGSAGKSWLAQMLCLLVIEGMSTHGLIIEDSANVLFLDYETSQPEIETRVGMLRNGLGLSPQTSSSTGCRLWYKKMSQSIVADLDELQRVVQERNIRFIVVDSVSSACGGAPEEAGVVLDMFDAIGKLQVPSLLIDHISKTKGDGTIFGSVFKRNRGRQVFRVRKADEEMADVIDIAMFHEKANNSRRISPMGWQLTIDNERHSATFIRKDVRDTALEPEMRIIDRIQTQLITNGPLSVKDLAGILDKSENHISTELSRNKNRFQRDSTNRFSINLLPSGTSELPDKVIIPKGVPLWEG